MGSVPSSVRTLALLGLFVLGSPGSHALANDPLALPPLLLQEHGDLPGPPRKMESHLPNYIGYNTDEGYDSHVDFRFSLKYSFFKYSRPFPNAAFRDRIVPHAAFTARMSQFIGAQDSSPVVGRQFNPELFVRVWASNAEDYIDLSYGHESNGQNINTAAEYQAKQDSLVADGDDILLADKFVSRGWDYLGLAGRKSLAKWGGTAPGGGPSNQLVLNAWTRYFLDDGFFQGAAEDYYPFEGGAPTERAQFDGLRMQLRLDTGKVTGFKASAEFITGYDGFLDHNTVRLELTAKNFGLPWSDASLPMTVWWQDGYNADLATYSRRSDSFGIGIEFE